MAKLPLKNQPVWLAHCPDYEPARLARLAAESLEMAGFKPASGSRVLVKPNLLWADPSCLSCTHPQVVRAACLYLLDCGCKLTVSDSPGFGRARRVAREIGLLDTLKDLNAPLLEMTNPVAKSLRLGGGSVGISRLALESDCILSIPRLKAHRQMRVSGAVKNLFGCISGLRKALLHTLHGDKSRHGVPAFPSLILDLYEHLPPSFALLDGIIGMHKTGPMKGEPFPAHLLAAGSPVALDTILYASIGLAPDQVPLWLAARRRKLPGAFIEDITLLGDLDAASSLENFEVPQSLTPQTFNPLRLCVSSLRRAFQYLKN